MMHGKRRFASLALGGALALAAGCGWNAGSEGAPSDGAGRPPPADVVRGYYAALASGQVDRAYEMWGPETSTRARGRDRFARSLLAYQSVAGRPTGPARIEGAAGTLHAEVPVRVSATRRGMRVTRSGRVRLERCNDGPGCSAEERRWHLTVLDLGGS